MKSGADFREETTAKLDELIVAIGDVEEARVSEEFENSVEKFFKGHGQRMEDAANNLDAMLDTLEGIFSHVQSSQAAKVVEGVDRRLLLPALSKLDPVSLNYLIE